LLRINGGICVGRELKTIPAHVQGRNSNSIGIALVGGTDSNLRPLDTRTPEQNIDLIALLCELKKYYPNAIIRGHNEVSSKACPCFDVQSWLKTNGIN
jgi:N-acetyl-anhydromuramyl-L-alanine amidase AmpD